MLCIFILVNILIPYVPIIHLSEYIILISYLS